MQTYFPYIKDAIIVLTPIISAIITYFSNKKSNKEIKAELDARLQEQNNATINEIQKMYHELEIHNRQSSWDSSIPITDEYIKNIEITRYGNITNLNTLVFNINNILANNDFNLENLQSLKNMLLKIELPLDEDILYPIEIIPLLNFKKLIQDLDNKIVELNNQFS